MLHCSHVVGGSCTVFFLMLQLTAQHEGGIHTAFPLVAFIPPADAALHTLTVAMAQQVLAARQGQRLSYIAPQLR